MEHFLTTNGSKAHEKNFEGPKLGSKLEYLPFLRGSISVFLDVAQDCRLGQCPASNRADFVILLNQMYFKLP